MNSKIIPILFIFALLAMSTVSVYAKDPVPIRPISSRRNYKVTLNILKDGKNYYQDHAKVVIVKTPIATFNVSRTIYLLLSATVGVTVVTPVDETFDYEGSVYRIIVTTNCPEPVGVTFVTAPLND